jgi:hypothetical protein
MLEQEVNDAPNTANIKDHILIFSKLARIFIIYDFYYFSIYIGWLLSGSSFFLIQWEYPIGIPVPASLCTGGEVLFYKTGAPKGFPFSSF